MSDPLPRASKLSADDKHRHATLESYVEGPRWFLPEGWIRKQIIGANVGFRRKGWKSIELISERRVTTLTTATIFFKIEGQAYPVQAFGDLLERALDEQ